MKSFLRKIFPFSKKTTSDYETDKIFDIKSNSTVKKEDIVGAVTGAKRIYRQTSEPLELDDSDYNSNIDDLVDEITKAKEVDGYIARVLANFREKAVKTGFYFESQKKENIKKVQDRLENILINSGSSTEAFLQECFNNYSSFGNVWIHKAINPLTEEILALTIMPSKGWTPKESYGVKVVKWEFEAGEVSKVYSTKNVFHLAYEKETHHVFGVPIVGTALDDTALLRELESSLYQDYLDSLEKRTIVKVGDQNNKATQDELDEVVNKLNSVGPNEDIVVGGHIDIEVQKPEFNSDGKDVVESSKQRVLSSLRSSGTSVGEMGAGRQDADTLGSQDDVVVEDLQSSLENQLNITIIRQICFDLFGSVTAENQVKIRFNPTFTTKERKEKHEIFKFLSNAITIEEVRAKLGEAETYQEKKLYGNLFAETGMTQAGANVKTNPTNQHGQKGSSKPSVKN